ncbi:hypothetical protein [Microvirga arsenatis]|uniref:Uncharacterized protein n=1 Tax=Microvirga arsenatis TaxID=2692265 RepID=A0ABW9Z3Q3_9HYPH|nr:hypothetical protein [Microvirga arsenatis]NBJ13878.1 hypothetical protein [Microvirga arsenatis]NBJ27327.1 hypothetical protein [Microvirga arsenatis]
MPLKEPYFYGTEERPHARKVRLAKAKEAASARAAKAYAAYLREKACEEAIDSEIEAIDFATPDGTYDRDRGDALLAQGFTPYTKLTFEVSEGGATYAASANPERRGRGRPRKYSAENPPPPRPSRARTAAGKERAAKGLHRRAPRKVKREASGTVSPVTASPARMPLPQVSPEVGRELPPSTVAGSAAIETVVMTVEDPDADFYAAEAAREMLDLSSAGEASSSEEASVSVVTKEPETEFEKLLMGPKVTPGVLDGQVLPKGELRLEAGAVPFEPGPVTEVERIVFNGFIESYHELVYYERGKGDIACHDYDFSDPVDRSKAKPWMLEMFPMFGLKLSADLQAPPFQFRRFSDLTEEEAKAWIDASIRLKIDDYLMEYFGRSRLRPSALLNDHRDVFAEDMWLEQRRREVWPHIQQRLIDVELYAHRVKKGEMPLEHALALFTSDEINRLSVMSSQVQDLYYQITDAMEWFEGFSPRDLLHWRGIKEPRFICRYRMYDGFPRWMYPEHLYDAMKKVSIVDYGFTVKIPMVTDDLTESAGNIISRELIRLSDRSEEEKTRLMREMGLPEEDLLSPDAPRLLIE